MEGRHIRPTRSRWWVLVAVAVLSLAPGTAQATHPRPKGATPLRYSLVPMYQLCAAPNRTHGAPLAFPSCNPPVQQSPFLTVGTPDANGAAANSVGSVRFDAVIGTPGPPEDSDIGIAVNVSDVRCTPSESASVCGAANSPGGPDYSGQLTLSGSIRATDHDNASSDPVNPVTMQDIPLIGPVVPQCQTTADLGIGGRCSLVTTVNAAIAPGAIKDGRRTSWELGNVTVADAGADGDAHTGAGNQFLTTGVFIP